MCFCALIIKYKNIIFNKESLADKLALLSVVNLAVTLSFQ